MSGKFRTRFAAKVLHSGGLLAYPTEAVWGLGCDPDNPHAVARLLTLKQRAPEKGLILVAASLEQLAPYIQELSTDAEQRLRSEWPGPLTWIVPAAHSAPKLLTGGRSTLAVRVSAHPLVHELCTEFAAPIVSTSANPAGLPPARQQTTARRYFGARVDYYLSGSLGVGRKPSEIRDLSSGDIIRHG